MACLQAGNEVHEIDAQIVVLPTSLSEALTGRLVLQTCAV